MTRRVTVIVEGREYLVEVGDLTERPIKATVNQKTYLVEVSAKNGKPAPPLKVSRKAPPVATANPPAPSQTQEPVSVLAGEGGPITAPMPGDICEIRVTPGDRVAAGDVVCVLEAMKMKNLIHTPHAGVIASVEVALEQAVDYGDVLVTFKPAE